MASPRHNFSPLFSNVISNIRAQMKASTKNQVRNPISLKFFRKAIFKKAIKTLRENEKRAAIVSRQYRELRITRNFRITSQMNQSAARTVTPEIITIQGDSILTNFELNKLMLSNLFKSFSVI